MCLVCRESVFYDTEEVYPVGTGIYNTLDRILYDVSGDNDGELGLGLTWA